MERVNKEQEIQLESVRAAFSGCPEHAFNPFQARSAIFQFIAPQSRRKLRFTLAPAHFLVFCFFGFTTGQ